MEQQKKIALAPAGVKCDIRLRQHEAVCIVSGWKLILCNI